MFASLTWQFPSLKVQAGPFLGHVSTSASDGFVFAVGSDAVVVDCLGWFLLWSWEANTESHTLGSCCPTEPH